MNYLVIVKFRPPGMQYHLSDVVADGHRIEWCPDARLRADGPKLARLALRAYRNATKLGHLMGPFVIVLGPMPIAVALAARDFLNARSTTAGPPAGDPVAFLVPNSPRAAA